MRIAFRCARNPINTVEVLSAEFDDVACTIRILDLCSDLPLGVTARGNSMDGGAGQHALTFQFGSCPEGLPMSLTHYALLNAQPREKTNKLFDGHGLYLQVAPSGGKWWRIKYRLGGREQCLSVGTFPAVALKAARQRCEELRAKLASGVDPAAEPRMAKQRLRMKDESFEVIAREWYATFSLNWAQSHGDRVLRRLETYVFPWIGRMPIREVTAMSVLECLRRLEHPARRVLRYCSVHPDCGSLGGPAHGAV